MTIRGGACRGFTLIELVVTLTLVSVLALVAVPLYEVTVTHNKEAELRTALRQMRTALDAYKAAADNGYIAKGAADSGFPPTLTTLVEGVDTIATPIGAPGAGTSGGSFGGGSGAAGGGFGSSSFGGSGSASNPRNNSGNSAFGGSFGNSSFGSSSSGQAATTPGDSAAGSVGANSTSLNALPAHMVFLRQIPRDPFFEDQSVAPELQWNLRAYGAQPGDFGGGADVYDVASKSPGTGLNGIAYKDW